MGSGPSPGPGLSPTARGCQAGDEQILLPGLLVQDELWPLLGLGKLPEVRCNQHREKWGQGVARETLGRSLRGKVMGSNPVVETRVEKQR